MDSDEAFKQLERIGKEHMEKWGSQQKTFDELDAFEALRDFIRYGFYRNRTDELAGRYIKYAHDAFSDVSQALENPKERVRLLAKKKNDLVNSFKNKVGLAFPYSKAKGIHPIDIKFLESVCNDFVPSLSKYNYHVRKLCRFYFKKGNLESLSKCFKSVNGVGQKIASLYLRDMLMLYERSSEVEKLTDKLTREEMLLVYPIDTWVKQISKRLLREKKDEKEIASLIIEKCENLGVSALFVNHGIWYLGAKSIDFILDNLDRIEMLKVEST